MNNRSITNFILAFIAGLLYSTGQEILIISKNIYIVSQALVGG